LQIINHKSKYTSDLFHVVNIFLCFRAVYDIICSRATFG